jgi:hypothetical protein
MVCSSPTDRFAAEDEPPVLQTAQHLWPKSSYPASCLWRGSTRRRPSQRRPQQTKPLAASNHEQSIAHPPPNNLSGEPHHTRRAFAHRTPFILLFPRGVTKANQDLITRARGRHTPEEAAWQAVDSLHTHQLLQGISPVYTVISIAQPDGRA